jgi:hypothetical protein
VYQYILDDRRIQWDINRLKGELTNPPDAIIVPGKEHRLHCTRLHRVSFSSASGFL